MPKQPDPQLPSYQDGIAAALLAAREATMFQIRPILRAHNLTEQQWRLLRVLIDNGPAEISKAAEASIILAPSVTRILKTLSQRRLITKTADATDKRKFILAVTDEGRRLVSDTAKETAALLETYKRQFGHKRFNNLIDELQAFQKSLKQNHKPSAN